MFEKVVCSKIIPSWCEVSWSWDGLRTLLRWKVASFQEKTVAAWYEVRCCRNQYQEICEWWCACFEWFTVGAEHGQLIFCLLSVVVLRPLVGTCSLVKFFHVSLMLFIYSQFFTNVFTATRSHVMQNPFVPSTYIIYLDFSFFHSPDHIYTHAARMPSISSLRHLPVMKQPTFL